ncbi:acetyl/propionyl/methylcrotonyl-CoA carboxylase subunit alpha [Marimonas arenosa]|uniref:3-methylcrotonyl-CoA carboxylase n=1 Tax=Marimonas arenosa TaxID=1795305 RepID=A0AAE3WCS9_9RHOB|nr:biotin carboxylase N-terminal domain-containing protein [Marimonas arenosa]MDQ2090581.1 3-methylcrotonyl-CoA carboxylase [Marimonas arenosa]
MFDTVLVANRGEIACRIIRTLKAKKLRAVAVYSDADADAPHVAAADIAVRIGPGPATESYLDGERLISAAQQAGAGAIHPGYGFLSENASFARDVEVAGLVFIGPTPKAIAAMGDKAAAKRVMEAAGVPCVPGYHGEDQGDDRLIAEAGRVGFPLMVKAAAGGGGKGLRLVHEAADLPAALARARSEALAAFGSDCLILEKALEDPRHIEIQLFADAHGACIHLGERDCSVQRRHQKVIEEAPAPGVSEALRGEMGAAAVTAAQAVGYRGAGTVEFLLDDGGAFYFLEMNTRLQVEHPVTEAVTGLDLVAMQIDVARGQPLKIAQADVALQGHAIEARLYAEDPGNGFLPAIGRIAFWRAAQGDGLRVDSGVASGSTVTPFYDPMLAKLIASGPDRETARQRLLAALDGTACLGVTTNAGFLSDILAAPDFAAGRVTTGFLKTAFPGGVAVSAPASGEIAIAGAMLLWQEMQAACGASLMTDSRLLGFASDGVRPVPLDLAVGGEVLALRGWVRESMRWRMDAVGWQHEVDLEWIEGSKARLRLDGVRKEVWFAVDPAGGLYLQHGARAWRVARVSAGAAGAAAGDGAVLSPMPGQVIALDVSEGDRVERGQRLAVLEAMKMQHQLVADAGGVVETVAVAPGAQVTGGQVIVVIGKESR